MPPYTFPISLRTKSTRPLSSLCNQLHDTADTLDLLLGLSGYISSSNNDRRLRKTSLAENFGIALPSVRAHQAKERVGVVTRARVSMTGAVELSLLRYFSRRSPGTSVQSLSRLTVDL
jgi:hypothetical protein